MSSGASKAVRVPPSSRLPRDVSTPHRLLQLAQEVVAPGRAPAEEAVSRLRSSLDGPVEVQPEVDALSQRHDPVEQPPSPATEEEIQDQGHQRSPEEENVLESIENQLELEDEEVADGDVPRCRRHGLVSASGHA